MNIQLTKTNTSIRVEAKESKAIQIKVCKQTAPEMTLKYGECEDTEFCNEINLPVLALLHRQ